MFRQITIVLLSIISCQFGAVDRSNAPAFCENFLAQWGKTPPELKFSGCKYQPGGQSNLLIAEYVVTGRDAKIVEQYLHAQFKMALLHRVCCIWEPGIVEGSPRYGSYVDRDGYYYQIVMGSGETIEIDWPKIPLFHIQVSKFMSDI